MKEVKPICVIYFPDQYYATENGNRNWIYEYAGALNGEKIDGRFKLMTDYTQYYWFCFYKQDIDAPELQVFNANDITPIQFQELKDIVMEEIKNQNNNH